MTGEQFTKDNEGLRLTSYACPAGHLTIGWGHNMEAHGIEVGGAFLRGAEVCDYIRNNGPIRISLEYAEKLLDEDYLQAYKDLIEYIGKPFGRWVFDTDEARLAALVDMSFQLGLTKLREFKNMRAAIRKGDWAKAAEEALDSDYAKQTPGRAHKVAAMLRTGEWPE